MKYTIKTVKGKDVGCILCEECDWYQSDVKSKDPNYRAFIWVCPYGGPFNKLVDSDGTRLPDDYNKP